MPLEATMVVIDNSEYMRNGDYAPTRFEAQRDAVNVIFQTKTDSNPESTVGVMTMAGKGPEVLVTNTKDLGQVLQGLHLAAQKIGGSVDLTTAINVAGLALKHRENKNLRQRILVLLGSPLEGEAADEKAMIKLAKKLKKNNVAVDVVCFGDAIEDVSEAMSEDAQEEGRGVLRKFVDNVNSSDNSHLVQIPPHASRLLSDSIMGSAVLAADRGAMIPEELREGGDGGGGAAGASNDFEFGIDPSLDPELAMALRLSMQEAQAREAAEASSSAAAAAAAAAAASSSTAAAIATPPVAATSSSNTTVTPATTGAPAQEEDIDAEMDPELAAALAMSREEAGMDIDEDSEMKDGEDDADDDEEYDDDEDEDEAIARAIEMSMQGNQQGGEPKEGEKK